MPFTASHVAAALPLLRTPLVPAAIVIGTVAPDLPYFLPFGTARDLTHAPLGIITIDLAIGTVTWLLWRYLFRAPVIDLSPDWLRERMPRAPVATHTRRSLVALLVLVSLILGSTTHLAWDSLTHPGWLVDHVTLLRTPLGPLPLEKWLQHASSVGGLVVVGAWSVHWVRRTHRIPSKALFSRRLRALAWAAVTVVFVVAGLASWAVGIRSGSAALDPVLVFRVARISIGLALAVAVAVCLGWLVRRGYSERSTATTLPRITA